MTIEQKAKAYEKALERAKAMIKVAANQDEAIGFANTIFPELKESEDEKIRKALINVFATHKDYEMFFGVSVADILAWLEKQDESIQIKKGNNYLCTKTHKYAGVEWIEGVKYYSPEDYSLVNQGCTCYCPKYSKEEHNNFFKEVEYDGCLKVDKIEPKFKVGDWIILAENHNSVYQVERMDNYRYHIRHYSGGTFSVHFDNELIRLWTLQDAEDGDVLISQYNKPFIYNGNRNSFSVGSYCGISTECVFKVAIEKCNWTENVNIHPATKEQRDLLFQKMKESGYEWDAEKKEPKKIEQKPTDNDMKELLHTEYEKGKHDAIAEIQNHAWSEEDESYLNTTIAYLKDAKEFKKSAENCINWLKSLKDRVQPILRRRHTIFDEII